MKMSLFTSKKERKEKNWAKTNVNNNKKSKKLSSSVFAQLCVYLCSKVCVDVLLEQGCCLLMLLCWHCCLLFVRCCCCFKCWKLLTSICQRSRPKTLKKCVLVESVVFNWLQFPPNIYPVHVIGNDASMIPLNPALWSEQLESWRSNFIPVVVCFRAQQSGRQ